MAMGNFGGLVSGYFGVAMLYALGGKRQHEEIAHLRFDHMRRGFG
eukprot:COSAG03_NODE_3805_length_1822_cov_2.173535_2_plen_45_part_00